MPDNTKLPVLDDPTRDAMIIGWASTIEEAREVARKHFVSLQYAGEIEDFDFDGGYDVLHDMSPSYSWSTDINTREECERAEAASGGFVIHVQEKG